MRIYSAFISRERGTSRAEAIRSKIGTSSRATGRRSRREMVDCGTRAARASCSCVQPLRTRSSRIRSHTGVTGQGYGRAAALSIPLKHMLPQHISERSGVALLRGPLSERVHHARCGDRSRAPGAVPRRSWSEAGRRARRRGRLGSSPWERSSCSRGAARELRDVLRERLRGELDPFGER